MSKWGPIGFQVWVGQNKGPTRSKTGSGGSKNGFLGSKIGFRGSGMSKIGSGGSKLSRWLGSKCKVNMSSRPGREGKLCQNGVQSVFGSG